MYIQTHTLYAYNIYIQYIIHICTLIYTMSYIHTYCIVFNHLYSGSRSLSFSEVSPTTVIDTVSEFIRQWCTTSGPRATSGPRRVVMWPAVSNKKRDYFYVKPRHLFYRDAF